LPHRPRHTPSNAASRERGQVDQQDEGALHPGHLHPGEVAEARSVGGRASGHHQHGGAGEEDRHEHLETATHPHHALVVAAHEDDAERWQEQEEQHDPRGLGQRRRAHPLLQQGAAAVLDPGVEALELIAREAHLDPIVDDAAQHRRSLRVAYELIAERAEVDAALDRFAEAGEVDPLLDQEALGARTGGREMEHLVVLEVARRAAQEGGHLAVERHLGEVAPLADAGTARVDAHPPALELFAQPALAHPAGRRPATCIAQPQLEHRIGDQHGARVRILDVLAEVADPLLDDLHRLALAHRPVEGSERERAPVGPRQHRRGAQQHQQPAHHLATAERSPCSGDAKAHRRPARRGRNATFGAAGRGRIEAARRETARMVPAAAPRRPSPASSPPSRWYAPARARFAAQRRSAGGGQGEAPASLRTAITATVESPR
jgi:hypothetical protein